jgi:hypothetical protein
VVLSVRKVLLEIPFVEVIVDDYYRSVPDMLVEQSLFDDVCLMPSYYREEKLLYDIYKRSFSNIASIFNG